MAAIRKCTADPVEFGPTDGPGRAGMGRPAGSGGGPAIDAGMTSMAFPRQGFFPGHAGCRAGFLHKSKALPRIVEGYLPKSTMVVAWSIFHPVWCLTGRSQDLQ